MSIVSDEHVSSTQPIQGSQNILPFFLEEPLYMLKKRLKVCNELAMRDEGISSHMSIVSDEHVSSTQPIQGSQNTLLFSLKEPLPTLKKRLKVCNELAMRDEGISSQLENSHSQQIVNNRYV